MTKSEIEHFYPKTKQHWRKWLEKNHIKKDAVWLIHYKKKSGNPTLAWGDAVDAALCFGWIDSKAVSIDAISYKQYYCKRVEVGNRMDRWVQRRGNGVREPGGNSRTGRTNRLLTARCKSANL